MAVRGLEFSHNCLLKFRCLQNRKLKGYLRQEYKKCTCIHLQNICKFVYTFIKMYLYNLGTSTLKTFSLKSLFVTESQSKLALFTTRQANESE